MSFIIVRYLLDRDGNKNFLPSSYGPPLETREKAEEHLQVVQSSLPTFAEPGVLNRFEVRETESAEAPVVEAKPEGQVGWMKTWNCATPAKNDGVVGPVEEEKPEEPDAVIRARVARTLKEVRELGSDAQLQWDGQL